MVLKESHQIWPARGQYPAREFWSILLIDMSLPMEHRMRDVYEYMLRDEEKDKVGHLAGTNVRIGIEQIQNGRVSPILKGKLLPPRVDEAAEDKKKGQARAALL